MKQINLIHVGTKVQSKSELYRALVVEGGLYLPPQKETSMLFISQICVQDKKCFFEEEVRVRSVPYIKGLRTQDLLDFIIHKCNAIDYLPDNYVDRTPNRTWLANICNTLDPALFQDFINEKLKSREADLLEKNNYTINIDSRIADIFEHSQMVPVKKGKSHLLLKSAINKKRNELQRQNEEEKDGQRAAIEILQEEITSLKKELLERDKVIDEYENDSEILKSLYNKGVIDLDGNVIE